MRSTAWFRIIHSWQKRSRSCYPGRDRRLSDMGEREAVDGRARSEAQQEEEQLQVEFREMKLEDIPQILIVERESFPVPWTEGAFHNELLHNQYAHYVVMLHEGQIIGYAGLWLIIDEAHITNI